MMKNHKYTTQEMSELVMGFNLELIGEYVNSKTPISIKCPCGNEFKTLWNRIQTGNTRSCGCLLKRFLARKMHEGISGTYWNHLVFGAQKRGIEFNITKQYAADIFKQQRGLCALSGQHIIFVSNYRNGTLQTASLDRIDSTKGYVAGNVQWVHKDINRLKGKMRDIDFIKICAKVALYNSIDGKYFEE